MSKKQLFLCAIDTENMLNCVKITKIYLLGPEINTFQCDFFISVSVISRFRCIYQMSTWWGWDKRCSTWVSLSESENLYVFGTLSSRWKKEKCHLFYFVFLCFVLILPLSSLVVTLITHPCTCALTREQYINFQESFGSICICWQKFHNHWILGRISRHSPDLIWESSWQNWIIFF